MDSKFLKEYLNSYGPSGFECELGVQKKWIEGVKKFTTDIMLDTYGTAVASIGTKVNPIKTVVVEAHCDEISYLVKYIDPKGFIKVVPNGGSDPHITPSMRVKIWSKSGPIDGIIGCEPIHLNKKKDSNDSNSIWIDVGMSKSGVNRSGISVGDPVTLCGEFLEMGDYYTGRALDNRIGGFILREVLSKLHNTELNYKLHFVNSVQEEVGLRGAQMISNRLKPDLAIVIDVCHDTTAPQYKSSELGDIKSGEGPVLTIAPSCHNMLRGDMIETLKGGRIKYQLKSASRSTGTDTESFAYSGSGVPTQLISIPLRYMHTTVESCHKFDVRETIKFLVKYLKELDVNKEYNYSKIVHLN